MSYPGHPIGSSLESYLGLSLSEEGAQLALNYSKRSSLTTYLGREIIQSLNLVFCIDSHYSQ